MPFRGDLIYATLARDRLESLCVLQTPALLVTHRWVLSLEVDVSQRAKAVTAQEDNGASAL